MSFYSDGNVETKYLDPKSFIDGARCTFDLGNRTHMAILPNMRLINVGIASTDVGRSYNTLIGVEGLIKNIRLLDGRTELTKTSNYQLYKGFVNSNQKNAKSISMRSERIHARLGAEIDNTTNLLDYPKPARGTNVSNAQSGATATHAGTIDLREALPMLNAIPHLPTDVFSNLKLEIEFTNDVNFWANDVSTQVGAMVVPTLVVDVLDNPEIVRKMNAALTSAQWIEIEHDQVHFPVSADDGGAGDLNQTQEINSVLDGFKNKRVERMLMVKEDPVKANYRAIGGGTVYDGQGWCGSTAIREEKVQVRVNGKNLLPRQGLVGNMERLGMLVDTYGDFTCYPGHNTRGIDTGLVFGTNAADGRKYMGNLSYNSWYIGDKVFNLQVTHSRKNEVRAAQPKPSTNALSVHYFGEVKKGLILGKNNYNIVYL